MNKNNKVKNRRKYREKNKHIRTLRARQPIICKTRKNI